MISALEAIEGSVRGLSDPRTWDQTATAGLLYLPYTQEFARREECDLFDAARRVTEEALTKLGEGQTGRAAPLLYGASGSLTYGDVRKRRRAEANKVFVNARDEQLGEHRFRTDRVPAIHRAVATQILMLVRKPEPPPPVKAGRSRMIGVIAPLSMWYTSYHLDLVKAIRAAADRERPDLQRRLVVIDVPREDPAELEAILTDQLVCQLSGLIIVNAKISDGARQALVAHEIPVVSVTCNDAAPPVVCSVISDHAAFADMLGHVLLENDCQSAVLVTKAPGGRSREAGADQARLEKRHAFERIAGAARLRALPDTTIGGVLTASAGILPGRSLIVDVDHYREEYGQQIFAMLADQLPFNSCVCFLADVVAISFLQACASSGRSARARGLRVTGFDNISQSEAFELTTVDYQLGLVARRAYERLQAAIDAPADTSYSHEVVPTRCYLRESTEW